MRGFAQLVSLVVRRLVCGTRLIVNGIVRPKDGVDVWLLRVVGQEDEFFLVVNLVSDLHARRLLVNVGMDHAVLWHDGGTR